MYDFSSTLADPAPPESPILSSEDIQTILELPPTAAADFAAALPFTDRDVTAGNENELQAVVIGNRENTDLPLAIEFSNFFKDVSKRSRAGDTSRRTLSALEDFLASNHDRVWENSWVRFPTGRLSPFAAAIFQEDLAADKGVPASPPRADSARFLFFKNGAPWCRVPVSYLLKLSLANAIAEPGTPLAVRKTGEALLAHFSNDNTSPETFSFHVVIAQSGKRTMGEELARETGKRFLLTQLLCSYANRKFGLCETGQEAVIYFAPHPPVRQQQLNTLIPDAFYRELFMSPCLSGWDRGEEKNRYMALCHQTMSRSQLNAVAKLKEAGIITRNLVVLPTPSNISLANNGTHISLGSRRLTASRARGGGLTASQEKYLADLVVKISEHFLPLFVGTYSGAPYRFAFSDFHPEKLLAFLPHQLDFTHLRMIWRRWKKKADLKLCRHPLTPFGPPLLDRAVSALFRLKGDFVPDFRLLDYLVCLLSTNQCPALDGTMGNFDRLKKDLADQGVFDAQMAIYLLCRPREYSRMGFSGFESRHYSLFANLGDDLAEAANLQQLITAFAFALIAAGKITHADIPDDPTTESERRQIFFAAAIDLPTFYIRKQTGNRLLKSICALTASSRNSQRYPGYLRIHVADFRRALVAFISAQAPELCDHQRETLTKLRLRLDRPAEHAAVGRLTSGILARLGGKTPLDHPAREFNLAAERYYRGELRQQYLAESLAFFSEDVAARLSQAASPFFREVAGQILGGQEFETFIKEKQPAVINNTLSLDATSKMIALIVLSLAEDIREHCQQP